MIAGSQATTATRAEIEGVILDGFFPMCGAGARPSRTQGALRVPAPQAAEDTQEHLLSNILGVVAVAQQAHTQSVDVRLETVNEQLQGHSLAPQTPPHQCNFVHGHNGLASVSQEELPGPQGRSFSSGQ